MKRFHVHLAVADLEESIKFYSTFFNSPPAVRKEDYAKWMLDDPRLNFAVSERGRAPGLDHLGLQVEDGDELKQVSLRLKEAGKPVLEQEQTTCCYAQSDKTWVMDPQGVPWETFYTTGSATTYGEDAELQMPAKSACCAPASEIAAVSVGIDCSKDGGRKDGER